MPVEQNQSQTNLEKGVRIVLESADTKIGAGGVWTLVCLILVLILPIVIGRSLFISNGWVSALIGVVAVFVILVGVWASILSYEQKRIFDTVIQKKLLRFTYDHDLTETDLKAYADMMLPKTSRLRELINKSYRNRHIDRGSPEETMRAVLTSADAELSDPPWSMAILISAFIIPFFVGYGLFEDGSWGRALIGAIVVFIIIVIVSMIVSNYEQKYIFNTVVRKDLLVFIDSHDLTKIELLASIEDILPETAPLRQFASKI